MTNEIVTFGEAMIRLSPPGHLRIEQTDHFEIQVGGAELNTAVGLAQLGCRVSWISRLPQNALGRLLAGKVRQTGVATDQLLFADNERLGVFFLEHGASPRPSAIVYDRVNSACANVQPGMIDWKHCFARASWYHVSGITAAISTSASAVVTESLKAAKTAGLKVSFDPNYRSKLWSHDAAKKWYRDNIEYLDILITSPEDAERYFDVAEADPERQLQALSKKYKLQTVAFTFRQGASILRETYSAKICHLGAIYASREYAIETVDRIGAGDAFAAGLIDGLLAGDPQHAVDYGAAMGALKHTIPGDFVFTTRAEIEELVQGGTLRVKR
ncbi:sugar kinase [Telmatocola sphagniphila]|uniref:Sugar kinase n=1 Tax=Telmatocola sphagniphila TaxID=1123043 RepID=A0A8E6B6J4_9BACT|nr:sugar kinase [Telmatocola sphagniphila]QVL32214.1 sugar kinase [Telmatocola sphagniphila]